MVLSWKDGVVVSYKDDIKVISVFTGSNETRTVNEPRKYWSELGEWPVFPQL